MVTLGLWLQKNALHLLFIPIKNKFKNPVKYMYQKENNVTLLLKLFAISEYYLSTFKKSWVLVI